MSNHAENVIKSLLEATDSVVQLSALRSLSQFQLSQSASILDETLLIRVNEKLAKILNDQRAKYNHREAAVQALSKIGGLPGIEVLKEFLTNSTEDIWLSEYTARILWETWDKKVFAYLLDYILNESADDHVRTKIIYEGMLCKIDYTTLVNFETLISVLLSGDSISRRWAATLLGALQDKRAVGPLVATLEDEDEDWYVQEGAIYALANLKDVRAVEALIKILEDDGGSLTRAALRALGAIDATRAIMPIINSLNDPDPDIRVAAIEILIEFGDSRALPKLAWMVENDGGIDGYNDTVKEMALKAINAINQRMLK
jgi:HEAT repeat protein